MEQQVRDLQEGGFLGELLDGAAPVVQDALLTVEEGDGAGGGTGVLVPGVQGDVARQGPQLADVDGLSPPLPSTTGSSYCFRSGRSLPFRCSSVG